MKKNFVHLHVHTEYSLLDGAARLEKLVQRTAELGMKALAITDHGVMFGVIDFYKLCKKYGIKPIIGCEVYVAAGSRFSKEARIDEERHHLILLAKDTLGYKNLIKLVSKSYTEGFYYKPRIDFDLLQEYHEGLICLSACLAGELPKSLLNHSFIEAEEIASKYAGVFGQGNYYIELQDHGMAEQKEANKFLLQLAYKLKLPVVASNDVHYVEQEDAQTQDILMCIQMNKLLNEENRIRFPSNEFYLKSPEEMQELFSYTPEALTNSIEIAAACNLEFSFDQMFLPNYEVPDGFDIDSYLEFLCWQGFLERYPQGKEKEKDRLQYELDMIKQMGYSGYFLITWDMISFARKNNIFVGPGRGSAAGSVVAYVLRITNIDPLKYDLLFERFLNPERVSMPDIDTDFCYERRGEVIEYLGQKYGDDHVAQIVTFGTMAAKGAIRDVGRVLNVSLIDVNKLSKLIPTEIGITLEKALSGSAELRSLVESNPQLGELMRYAKQLEGMPRHNSTHAAGVVISKDAIDTYLPVLKAATGPAITQFTMTTVEDIGLLKMDLLGLRTLTVIGKTVELLNQKREVAFDLDQLPLDDEGTYQMLGEGESFGVFQLESAGLRSILKNLKPNRFGDLIALVALYRPGPLGSGMVEDFIARRHGRVDVKYIHPLLEPILSDTYGVILYQEQVMRIASDLAGFTLGQADLLRRAMGKKKADVIQALRENFLQGSGKLGIAKNIANEIFNLMEYFAGYGFNKSHSAAYALLSYQTAYLKCHYPAEFMSALLSTMMGNSDKLSIYIEESHRLKIEILPPDINESFGNFTATHNKIRFGLAAVKGVGDGAISAIIAGRKDGPYLSLLNFCERVELAQVNKKCLENLIYAGAFSNLGIRSRLLSIMDTAIAMGAKSRKDQEEGQLSFFDLGMEKLNNQIREPNIPEFTDNQILLYEKELLGCYISGHPLDDYREWLKYLSPHQIGLLNEDKHDKNITLVGLLSNLNKVITKKGDAMANFQLEDFSGSLACLVFPRIYQQLLVNLQQDSVVVVKGRYMQEEEQGKFFVENVQKIYKGETGWSCLWLKSTTDEVELLKKVAEILLEQQGETKVNIIATKKQQILPNVWPTGFSVNLASLQMLEELLGAGNVLLQLL
ncbi:MAG: DNA polymerase III subunit alpha [Clostridia bacterium]